MIRQTAVRGSVILLASCSLVVDTAREQCTSDLNCSNRGGAFEGSVCINSLCQPNPAWACVGMEQTFQQRAMQAPLEAFDIQTGMGIAGVVVELCNRPDFDCKEGFNSTTTDEQGMAQVSLVDNFAGYIKLSKAGAIDETLVFPTWPLAADETLGTIPLLGVGAPEFLANQLGVAPIQGRGLVSGMVVDCQGAAAVGAVLAFQGDMSNARPFYGFNGLPSSTAVALDQGNLAGVLNAVPGYLGIQANIDGNPVSQASILVHPGRVTLFQLKSGYGALKPF